ncbi:MAG: alcohol dehydrogenase catalytic domain-containing protein [Chloroflexi bacterium]|nr:alcohol dehydrogenase catalytic domain-containing protein [Chloroflexota bacterium]
MQAAYLYGTHDLRLIERAPDPVGPEHVRIAISATGICGTDLHIYDGLIFGAGMTLPRPFGHEYAGRIVEAGEGVAGLAVGDRVTAMPSGPCRHCVLCRTGRESVCRDRHRALSGSWATSLVAPADLVWRVPDDVPDHLAALTEPLSCAVRAVERARLRSADRVVVIGGGPIGLLIALVAQASGARDIIVSEPRPYRRELARSLGFDTVVDPTTGNLPALVRDRTDGLGAEVVFEVVGLPATIEAALPLVAPGGTLAIVGVTDLDVVATFTPQEVFFKEMTIVGAREFTGGADRALRWLSRLDLTPLITHTLPLAEVQRGIDLARSGQAGKVLLIP